MKKLILIPTTLVTGLLALAFVLPGQATGVLRAVAPSVHIGTPSVISAGGGSSTTVASHSNAGTAPSRTSSSSASSQSPSGQLFAASVNGVSTPSQQNCGRFGNGFHGGKHLFVCPNRPFPAPVITHFP
jgi:hypothetical protein